MAPLLDDLAAPFDPVEPESARTALARTWGLDATSIERLDTERDDTFRATTEQGDVLLKIAHPADDPAVVDFQVRAMLHVQEVDPGIPIQRVVPAQDGAVTAAVDGRVARVLTYLHGDLVLDGARSPSLYAEAGGMLGRLNGALASYEHPASDRDLAWDLPRLPELLPDASDPLHVEVIMRFAAETAPALARLPHQVIHNDGHPGNLLVDPADPGTLSGILDFGDALRSARICDLGVSLAYLVPDAPRPWPEVDAFLAGFERAVPLLPEERALLPMLVAARTIMRNVINQRLHRDRDEDLHGFYARNDRKLRRILTEEF